MLESIVSAIVGAVVGAWASTALASRGKGWEVSELQQKVYFDILHEYHGGDYFVALSFNNPPPKVSDPRQPNKRVPAPEDWVSWFEEHPYLKISSPQPTSVGGVQGRRSDTRVAS
jgi:hypothetical protein